MRIWLRSSSRYYSTRWCPEVTFLRLANSEARSARRMRLSLRYPNRPSQHLSFGPLHRVATIMAMFKIGDALATRAVAKRP